MHKCKLSEDKGIVYSSRVRVGNWYEDSKLEEARYNMFLDPMIKGEILLSKYRKMSTNLNAPTDLTRSTGTIPFGGKISLHAPDVPATHPSREDAKGLVLGGQLWSEDLLFTQDLHNGCSMVAFPDLLPREKNTFVIISHDNSNRDGETLKYNQEFCLILSKSVKVKAPPLYVRYQNSCVPEPANVIPIQLSAKRDTNCRWTTVPLLPRDRLEGIGQPIQTGTKLIIKNCVADKSLSVMYQNWMQTFFGMECGVTCRDFIDVHKRFTAENIFSLVSDVATKKKE